MTTRSSTTHRSRRTAPSACPSLASRSWVVPSLLMSVWMRQLHRRRTPFCCSEELAKLEVLVDKHGGRDWPAIASELNPHRTAFQWSASSRALWQFAVRMNDAAPI